MLSAIRQRGIANILLLINLVLLAMTGLSVAVWRWQPLASTGNLAAAASVWGVSQLLLLLASGFGPWMIRSRGIFTGVVFDASEDDPAPLVRARKYFFYAGVALNFTAIAIGVEETGGLLKSPFSSILLGLILSAQQLGRYRRNSIVYFACGSTLVLLIYLLEGRFFVPHPSEPPTYLLFVIMSLSFGLAAVVNIVSKPPNPQIDNFGRVPTAINIYRDSYGQWRYCIYAGSTRLDSPLEPAEREGSLESAKSEVERVVAKMGVGPHGIRWRDHLDKREALGIVEGARSRRWG